VKPNHGVVCETAEGEWAYVVFTLVSPLREFP